MARNYTVEDVETLRSKGGVSYEEAIRLLDKYDGDVASALIELEKGGKLHRSGMDGEKIGQTVRLWWNKGMESRVLISRKERTLVDVPVLVALLMTLAAPKTMLVAAVILLLSGGHILLDVPRKEEVAVVAPSAVKVCKVQPEPEEQQAQQEEEAPAEPGFEHITIE